MVIHLHHGGPPQNLQQHRHPFAGNVLDQSFNVTQGCVLQTHLLPQLELVELLNRGLITQLLNLTNALHHLVVQQGWLKTKSNQRGHAFGAANR